MDKNQIITAQGWLPYQSRKTGAVVLTTPNIKLNLNLSDFDKHPDNFKLLNHVIDISNHPCLKAVTFKMVVKDYYQLQRWLKGKKIVVTVVEE